MINIVKKKINMSDELKAKINWSCKFNKKRAEGIQNNLNNFDKDIQKEKDNSRSM